LTAVVAENTKIPAAAGGDDDDDGDGDTSGIIIIDRS